MSAYALEFEITRSRTPNPLKHKSFSSKTGKKETFHMSSCLRNKTRRELRIQHHILSFTVFTDLGVCKNYKPLLARTVGK